jgi:hypothetical protein
VFVSSEETSFLREDGKKKKWRSERFMRNVDRVCVESLAEFTAAIDGSGCYCGQGVSNVSSRFITLSYPICHRSQ